MSAGSKPGRRVAHRWARTAAIPCLLAIAVGCTQAPRPPQSAAREAAPAAAGAADHKGGEREAATAPQSAAKGPALPPLAMAPPAAMRQPANLAGLGPDRLLGLSKDQLEALLGAPGFTRRDPPAEIWQYANGTCILDVFLYAAGNAYKVTYVEARGRSVVKVAKRECYLSLFEERRKSG